MTIRSTACFPDIIQHEGQAEGQARILVMDQQVCFTPVPPTAATAAGPASATYAACSAPLASEEPLFYVEFAVAQLGPAVDSLAVGVTTGPELPMDAWPFAAADAWDYTCLGAVCHANELQPYGLRPWRAQDVIGCGVGWVSESEQGVFFTHNGKYLGMACTFRHQPTVRYAIGLRGQWALKLLLNVGQAPFRFNPNTWKGCQATGFAPNIEDLFSATVTNGLTIEVCQLLLERACLALDAQVEDAQETTTQASVAATKTQGDASVLSGRWLMHLLRALLAFCTHKLQHIAPGESSRDLPLLQHVLQLVCNISGRAIKHEGIRAVLKEWLPLLSRSGRYWELRSTTLLLVRVLMSELKPSFFEEEGRRVQLPAHCDPSLHLWVNMFWADQGLDAPLGSPGGVALATLRYAATLPEWAARVSSYLQGALSAVTHVGLAWTPVHKHCAIAVAVLGGWQLPKYIGAYPSPYP